MPFDQDKYYRALNLRIEQYVHQIELLFGKYASKVILAAFQQFDGRELKYYTDFFSSNPNLRKSITEMMTGLTKEFEVKILEYGSNEWYNSYTKNQALVKYAFRTLYRKLPKSYLETISERNLKGLVAFQKRRTQGLSLSDQVWRITKGFEREIGMALNVSLVKGRSAAATTRDVKSLLKNPDALFRRVRNQYGNLVLSKVAKNYHPGQGVYRSAYKNALRFTRTEINMTYRKADSDRWQSMDFVRGIEVKRSKNWSDCPVCEKLKGIYPKNFVFIGWHPNCRCYTKSVLFTEKEMELLTVNILSGKDNSSLSEKRQIKELPNQMKEFLKENKTRMQKAKSPPYWLQQNQSLLNDFLK